MSKSNAPHPKTPDVMLTGATGLIGRFLLLELLRRGRRVLALVRDPERRRGELASWVAGHGVSPSGLWVGDFSLESWGAGSGSLAGLPISGVKDVYHLAARFEFGLPIATARAANVDASLRFLEAVAELPELRRYVSVSGYRVSGSEGDPAGNYARLGAYEASKLEEHSLLRRRAEELGVPLNVVNPSTVIGATGSGETFQTTGVGDVARQLFFGKMPAQVGSVRTFVPLVGVEHVARFMAELPLHEGVVGEEYWLLHPDAPNLPELVQRIGELMGVGTPRLRLPVGLIRALPRALTGAEPESLGFLSEDRYPTAGADRLASEWGFEAPDFDDLLRAWLGYLIGTRFLQRPARSPRLVSTRAGQILAEGGTDSDLVLLHGLPLDGTSWDPLIHELGEDALVVDLPGLGRSGDRPRGFDYGDSSWLEDLDIDRGARLVGHSLGCAIALDYALAHPERVKELLLVAPAFLGGEMAPWLRVPALVRGVLRWGSPRQLERQLFGDGGSAGFELGPAVVESTHESSRRGHVRRSIAEGLAWAGDPRVRKRSVEKLAMVRAKGVPVRVFCGEHDRPRSELLPGGVELSVQPAAGHYPQLTHAPVLAAWLTRGLGKSSGVTRRAGLATPSS